MKKIIKLCPICNSKLIIRELECPNCNLSIKGMFELDKLSSLPDEMLQFLIVFIKNRGNIKDIEKELNISYPTVRTRIDDLLTTLGFPLHKEQEEISKARNEILDRLEKGEIDTTQAIDELKKI